ncbi:cytochrome c3 family protein [Sutterella wadsworthensis]|uniref:cytochrome c3 family protein n=2 Tax=Sutterella wadsworthensis TaxID=40545 RepID=UPI0009D6B4D8
MAQTMQCLNQASRNVHGATTQQNWPKRLNPRTQQNTIRTAPPHYGIQLDCVNCHHGHEESEDYCAQCHNFGFNVP